MDDIQELILQAVEKLDTKIDVKIDSVENKIESLRVDSKTEIREQIKTIKDLIELIFIEINTIKTDHQKESKNNAVINSNQDKDIKEIQEDIDGLGTKIETKISILEPIKLDVFGLKKDMNLTRWAGGIIGASFILYELNKFFEIINIPKP